MVDTDAATPRGRAPGLSALVSVELDAEAALLRSEGMTFVDIGKRQGVHHITAKNRATRGLRAIPAETVAEQRAIQQQQIDFMYNEALKVLRHKHIVVNNGVVIIDPHTGEPLLDTEPILRSIQVMLKVQDRRARLFGLDAPSRALVMSANEEAVDRQIRILLEESGQYGQTPVGGSPDRGADREVAAIEATVVGEEAQGDQS